MRNDDCGLGNDDCGMNGGKNKLDRKEIKERGNQFADCSEIKTQAMEPESALPNPYSVFRNPHSERGCK